MPFSDFTYVELLSLCFTDSHTISTEQVNKDAAGMILMEGFSANAIYLKMCGSCM